MRLITLASGSSGNSSIVEIGKKRLMIDCGISTRRIMQGLTRFGIAPESIDAILVTHEHNDHIRGIDSFAKRHKIPVYLSMALYISNKRLFFTEHSSIPIRPFYSGTSFKIEDITINPFPLPHDVVDHVGFRIEGNGLVLGYATDIGHVTGELYEYLSDINYLILESNHDTQMLQEGYPLHLKKRIQSGLGHISNDESRKVIEKLIHPNLRHIILVHLSKINNTPEKVLETMGDLRYETLIDVAPRHDPVDWTAGDYY